MIFSPLARRRWHKFKANKRGYWSFWLFLLLFIVSLFAEVLANEKPIAIVYDDKILLPIVNIYPETSFGGDFETDADYCDP